MDKTKKRGSTAERALFFAVASSFIFSLIYIPIRASLDEIYRESTEYRIMIFQSAFGLAMINLPTIMRHFFDWTIPSGFSIIFILFLWSAIFAGEVLQFYYRIPIWDDILHLTSSMMATVLGFSLIYILNGAKRSKDCNPSPLLVSAFSAAFSVFIGVLWEIYEYAFDGILNLNMQKFAVESHGSSDILRDLLGRAALTDTMSDLIVDALGAVIISVLGYISQRRGGKLFESFKISTKTYTTGD